MACLNWNKMQLRDLSELESSERLTNRDEITEAYVCFNFVTEVPPSALSGLHRLTVLALNCNSLTAIPPFTAGLLPALTELHLASNRISSLQHLEHLPRLRLLDLSCNRIPCLDNLAACAELESLSLSSNLIASVNWDGVPTFSQLRFLGLYCNQLSSLFDVLRLLSLTPVLTSASLGCNPFSGGKPLALSPALLSTGHLHVAQVGSQVLPELAKRAASILAGPSIEDGLLLGGKSADSSFDTELVGGAAGVMAPSAHPLLSEGESVGCAHPSDILTRREEQSVEATCRRCIGPDEAGVHSAVRVVAVQIALKRARSSLRCIDGEAMLF